MARPAGIVVVDGRLRVTLRGNRRRTLVFGEEDCCADLACLKKYARKARASLSRGLVHFGRQQIIDGDPERIRQPAARNCFACAAALWSSLETPASPQVAMLHSGIDDGRRAPWRTP